MVLNMKLLRTQLAMQGGFSLVELVLTVALIGILSNIVSQTMMTQTESYAFVSHRKTAMSDARYAINRIAYDAMRVEIEDITALSGNSIYFVDFNGLSTDYHVTSGNLMKGSELFLEGIQSFNIVAYDAAGIATLVLADVRKFKFTVVTVPKNGVAGVTLSTTVIPRTLLYAGYE
jgi:prepilin-type N-terminal cleavage/methylation domain-containing protein